MMYCWLTLRLQSTETLRSFSHEWLINYTSLIVVQLIFEKRNLSLLSLISYKFCLRIFHIAPWVVFLKQFWICYPYPELLIDLCYPQHQFQNTLHTGPFIIQPEPPELASSSPPLSLPHPTPLHTLQPCWGLTVSIYVQFSMEFPPPPFNYYLYFEREQFKSPNQIVNSLKAGIYYNEVQVIGRRHSLQVLHF